MTLQQLKTQSDNGRRLTYSMSTALVLFLTFTIVASCFSPLTALAEGFRPLVSLENIATTLSTLAKGKFLVASRDLSDPNFAESVILLIDYNENGAMGVIINRPTQVTLPTLLPKVKALQQRKEVVYLGGPVARHLMVILTQTAKPPEGAQSVVADLYLVSEQEALEKLLHAAGKRTKLRAYVGYAGWASGQLEMEVARGGWHVVPADLSMVFDHTAEKVWPELIRRGDALWTQISPPTQLFSLAFMMPQ
ncbi:MAG: YqgE/AlgH family protein [Candidatus Binatia bacterium]